MKLSEKEVYVMYVAFQSLIKDLEPFVDITKMWLAFDKDGQALVVAPDFTEVISNKPLATGPNSLGSPSHMEAAREKMRQAIAKHRSIHSNAADPFANSQDIPIPQSD